MKTKNAVSTILYDEILTNFENNLKFLKDIGYIESYIYIKHNGDVDDKKDHYHVLLFPQKRVDTLVIRDNFKIVDEVYACLPFRETKSVSDWLLYSMHNDDYLKSKGLSRNFTYQLTDFKTNEGVDFVNQLYNDAVLTITSQNRVSHFINYFKAGIMPQQIICSGLCHMNEVGTIFKIYESYKKERDINK